MIFLLDPNASWPARWIDAITGENEGGARVKRLRDELSQAWLAGYFTTPEDLARQVSAAVHRREMSDRLGTMELTIRTGLEDALMAGGPIKGRFTVRRTRLAPEMISTPPSPDFQKAPTRGPASLVAIRALAGGCPARDTAIVGHRNFAIEHDLACVGAHAEVRFIRTALLSSMGENCAFLAASFAGSSWRRGRLRTRLAQKQAASPAPPPAG
jgi:hypothetical protein